MQCKVCRKITPSMFGLGPYKPHFIEKIRYESLKQCSSEDSLFIQIGKKVNNSKFTSLPHSCWKY